MTREWDAPTYDALPLPHVRWGQGVVARLAARPGERVLDAGCGTGRDAALLGGRVPDVELVLLDGSQAMLDAARARLGEGATYVRADLAQPLPVEPVDAVMSVACFHWVVDHDALFRHLAQVLRPGGRLVSDCGGQGQLQAVDAALRAVLGTGKDAHTHYAGTEDTRQRLEAAGFAVRDVRLRPDPLRLDDPDLLERYLATVVLSAHVAERSEQEAADLVREVRRAMPEPVLDYVRLEVEAVLAP